MSHAAALRISLTGAYLRRSLWTMALVGSALNLINQGDVLMGQAVFEPLKFALTYAVPFCVSTYAAASAVAQSGADG